MSTLASLIAACDSLATDSRYAKKTRALARSLKAFVQEGAPVSNVVIQKIGPFPVSFDSPNLDSQVALAELAAGTTVLRAWARAMALWDQAVSPTFMIGAGGAGALTRGDWWKVTEYAPIVGPQEDAGAFNEANTPAQHSVTTLKDDGWLVAYASGSPASGSAEVYALILVPT